MNLGIDGRVAMVAAGTQGIGLATALTLQSEGCRVSVCGRSEETLAQARQSGLLAIRADVSVSHDLTNWFNQVVETIGSPQILVTNTGGPPAGAWPTLTDDQWQAGFESSLLNVVRMVRLVAPPMSASGWGRIIHISSLVARQPSELLPISSTLRTGLMAMTRLQATELAGSGVTVNGVLPGHTLTNRQRHLADLRAKRDGITPAQALLRQAEEVPAKRLATPEEIGAAIAFLASDQAAYITGTNLLVDGGMTLGLG